MSELCARIEIGLVTSIVAIEVAVLCAWVVLNGLATPAESEGTGGILVRAIVGAAAVGGGVAVATRRWRSRWRSVVVSTAVIGPVLLSPLWRGVGVDYASNTLNWIQQSSSLTLFGGLRGIATRLTLLLSVAGAAIAAGFGKHVTIDLVTRWAPPRARQFLTVLGSSIATGICFVLAWGFFDHASIEGFRAPQDASPQEKLRHVLRGVEEHAFILHRQLELDLKSLRPVLIERRPYSSWLDSEAWNVWLDGGGFSDRYGAGAAESLRIPAGETRAPMVIVPRLGEPRGELLRTADLAMSAGLVWIGLRILLRTASIVADPVGVTRAEEKDWAVAA